MKKIFILAILSFFGCKDEPICYVDQNNAGKQIYDLEEATCFIALRLNKKATDLDSIRNALIAEENFMIKIGLISEEPIIENENEPPIELDMMELVKYAQEEEKVDLSTDDLLEIYNTETEYAKFIGVVE